MRNSTVYTYQRGVGGREWSLEKATCKYRNVIIAVKTAIIMTLCIIMTCAKINGHNNYANYSELLV